MAQTNVRPRGGFRYKPRVPVGIVKKLPWTRPSILRKEVATSDSVLDLGCGPQSQLLVCDVAYSVGVELFEPYLEAARATGVHDEYLGADVRELSFEPGSFDVVLALDILDNLEKAAAYDLVVNMRTWARKAVIVTVPNGYIPEGALDSNPLQVHKSGYVTEELEDLGFRVYGMGLKLPAGLARLHEGQGIIGFLVTEVATYPCSLLTWHWPKLAGELVGIHRKRD